MRKPFQGPQPTDSRDAAECQLRRVEHLYEAEGVRRGLAARRLKSALAVGQRIEWDHHPAADTSSFSSTCSKNCPV
jgi:hypothetical protein